MYNCFTVPYVVNVYSLKRMSLEEKDKITVICRLRRLSVMREKIRINDGWIFKRNGSDTPVDLPHTWNASDGQDGTNGYDRGRYVYRRKLNRIDTESVVLEFEGVNSVCEVFIDGEKIGGHKGGYSHFRFDITDYLKRDCELSVAVDNRDASDVYPSAADFTFWGGIYRNVNLITSGKCRFSSSDCSSDGVYVTPFKSKNGWRIGIKALIDNPVPGAVLHYDLKDADNKSVVSSECDIHISECIMECGNVNLWNGRKSPYLYTFEAKILLPDGTVSDNLCIKTGFREYSIDADKGFYLNREHIKIHGLCRHQDRENMGNAITEKEHREDIEIILETGANALRLAHYQQDSFFYDLCDEKGLLVWAEVPVISRFSAKKQANAKQQLSELIRQNYNHPAIFCWGIENEITIATKDNGTLQKNLSELAALAKKADKTRYTTCAQVSMLAPESSINNITDILGYNHYFGWYVDSCSGIGKWLDEFRRKQPGLKLCLSEYGAEAVLRWQNDKPEQGDYSEQYQCVFHERYLEEINKRDWLWGSFLWNTFDFGVARRNEGGLRGRNNKGLVTYDRKTKKDAFYLYKASWSSEKVLHVCGSRYINRPVGGTTVKIYSNLPEVTLKAGDKEYTQQGQTVFVFENIPVEDGENIFTASAGDLTESIRINGVREPDESYVLPEDEHSFIRNWFSEGENVKPDYLSLEDNLADILGNEEIKRIAVNQLGPKANLLFTPLTKLLKFIKAGSALKAASKFGIPDNVSSMAQGFLQTVKK